MIRAEPVYLNNPETLVVVFDVRETGGAAALHKQHAVLADFADIEALEEDHFALIVRPGWVSEAAA
jgi:hypothetical protein